MHGQFVWYELMTTDSAGAQRFYPPITGWGTQKWDAPNTDYMMWTAGGETIAGIVQLTEAQQSQGIRPNWLPYVAVDNVDQTLAKATSLGAKVTMPPMDMPDVGRMAVIQDPQGAAIAVYRPSNAQPGFDGTPKLGNMCWHDLTTTDYSAALSFYGAVFGWQKAGEMDMGGGMIYVMFGHGGKPYGGMYNRTPQMGNMPPNWVSYVNVRDVNAAVAAIKRGGGKVLQGPLPTPDGGLFAQASDPQGTMFALFQSPAQATEPAKKATQSKAKASATAKSKPKKAKKAKASGKPKKKDKKKDKKKGKKKDKKKDKKKEKKKDKKKRKKKDKKRGKKKR